MSKAFSRLRQRVVEATGKTEVTTALTGEMQDAEQRIGQIKTCYESVAVRAEATCLSKRHTDTEKRIHKFPKGKLAEAFRTSAHILDATEGVGYAMEHMASAEDDLCKIYARYEDELDAGFLTECQEVINNSKRIIALRQALETRRLDRDIAKKEMAKAPVEKSNFYVGQYTDARTLFEEAKDKTETGMVDLLATEPDMVISILKYCETQQRLFADALKIMNETVDIMRREAYSSKLFSRNLTDYWQDTGFNIPPIVEHCIWALNDVIEEEGIFRMSGNTNTIRRFRTSFNTEDPNLNLKDEKWEGEHHAVAGVLKLYFREMPNPLLCTELYQDWIAAAQISDHNEKLYALKDLTKKLPTPNHDTLLCLIRFLAKVVSFSDTNKMKASNLGIVFGPTLLFQSEELMSMGSALQDSGMLASNVENLITYYSWIFDDESDVQDVLYFTFNPKTPGESYPGKKMPDTNSSLNSHSKTRASKKLHRKSLSHLQSSVPSVGLDNKLHHSSTLATDPHCTTKKESPLCVPGQSHTRSHSTKEHAIKRSMMEQDVNNSPTISSPSTTTQTPATSSHTTPVAKSRPTSIIKLDEPQSPKMRKLSGVNADQKKAPMIPTKPNIPAKPASKASVDTEKRKSYLVSDEDSTPQAAMARAMMGMNIRQSTAKSPQTAKTTVHPKTHGGIPRGPPPPLPGHQ
eukprot:CFRG4180T1